MQQMHMTQSSLEGWIKYKINTICDSAWQVKVATEISYSSFMGMLDTLEIFHILNDAEILTPDDCWWDVGHWYFGGIFFFPNWGYCLHGAGFPCVGDSLPTGSSACRSRSWSLKHHHRALGRKGTRTFQPWSCIITDFPWLLCGFI